MLNCFTCNSLLPERGIFCKKCGTQFKCKDKSCSEFLEPDADVCVWCGEPIGSGGAKSDETTSSSPTMNTFEFKETRNERSAKAIFTDNIGDSIKEALALVVSSYPLGTIVRRQNAKQPQLNGELFPEAEETDNSNNEINITPKQIPKTGNETEERIKKLFYLDEDSLTLEVQDLKAMGPKEYGIRLVYLRLLYSKDIQGEEFITRDNLNETLKEVMGSLDSNVVSWISKNNDLALKQDGEKVYVRLKGDGYNKALAVLNEVYDENLKGSHIPERKSRGGSKNSSSKSDESQKTSKSSSKISQSNTDVKSWAEKWKSHQTHIDGYSAVKDKSAKDKGVFGLWAISLVSPESKIVSSAKISNFLRETFVIKIDESAVRKSLNDSGGLVIKVKGGYQINSDGIKHAETLAGISSAEPKTKGKK